MLTRTNRQKSTRGVLFDLDGTLVDTVRLILESMRHATHTVMGCELSDDALGAQVGIPLLEQLRSFSEEHADEMLVTYREHNERVHDELISEYPGVKEVLRELQGRGVAMGIVTSKRRSVAIRGVDLFALEQYFDTIICADDVDRHKPDPHPIEHAAGLLGMSARDTVYVGDSPYDVQAANAAGAISVAVTWGFFDREELAPSMPDYVVDTPEQMGVLLSELTASAA